jgi:hypothetical protein
LRGLPSALRPISMLSTIYSRGDNSVPHAIEKSTGFALMSALPPKADIGTRSPNVRSVPKADIRAVIRSVELIVQPGAKDGVGEMSVGEGLSPGRRGKGRDCDICVVERAEVHVKALYFVGPTGN